MTSVPMNLKLAYRPYRREFLSPLRTAHGEWQVREGFIVRVESAGGVGYGEIAPLPEFGTETLARAADFLAQWVRDPIMMPSGLPCCSFALTTAIQHSRATPGPAARDFAVAGLLPAGSAALAAAKNKLATGYSALKWKIGVQPIEAEKEIFEDLLGLLPATASLRLDANAGLSRQELQDWLALLGPHAERIEFLEQPLPPGQEDRMAEFARASGVPIALDESLNAPGRERWLSPGGWAGPLVIKPLLMGNITALLEQLRPLAAQLVFSSVFETGIGLVQALQLADALPIMQYAIGFDTIAVFDDALTAPVAAPVFQASARTDFDPEVIWKQLPPLN